MTLLKKLAGATIVAGFAAIPAVAGPVTIQLGGGWQAHVFDSKVVDLHTDFVDIENDRIVIEKFAEFIDVDPDTGLPRPIQIVFEQIGADDETVSRIAITDEIVVNHTGLDWTSFMMAVLDSGSVSFNQADSATFSIEPYTTRTYNGDSTEVVFAGGVVANNGIWTPGLASGALYIDVDLSGEEPVLFTLKETPIPEPSGLILLVAGAAVAVFRRRV